MGRGPEKEYAGGSKNLEKVRRGWPKKYVDMVWRKFPSAPAGSQME